MRPEAERWWRQAQEDIKTAKAMLAGARYAASAFFAQQAVEKAFKGAIIQLCRLSTPRTHDLLDLSRILGECSGKSCQDIKTTLRQLNHHYAVSRYPDAANGIPEEQYDEQISGAAIIQAEELLRWLGNLLK